MTLKLAALSIRDDTKWPLYKWFQRGVLDFPVKAKDGRPKCPSAGSWNLFDSAQVQSTAFVNWHSECLQEERRRRRRGKKKKNKQQNKKSQNSVFLNSEHKEQFLWFSCLFYSKCHSVSESAFGALRQRCKVQRIKYLQPRPNGVGFTRARGKDGWGAVQDSGRSSNSLHQQTQSY